MLDRKAARTWSKDRIREELVDIRDQLKEIDREQSRLLDVELKYKSSFQEIEETLDPTRTEKAQLEEDRKFLMSLL